MLRALFFFLLILSVVLSRPPACPAGETFDLWIHPFFTATEIINRFTPLANYLGEKLGQPIKVRVSKNYEDHINRVGRNDIDIAYMGPAPYVLMTRRYGQKPLLACLEVEGTTSYHGMIVVRRDSKLTELSQLAGARFAFGDENSTMSHLVPRFMLLQAGVGLKDFSSYSFLKSHRNVALGVLGGYYDAGALKESVFRLYEPRGLRVLATSPDIPTHLLLTRNGFPADMLATLRQVLLHINENEQGRQVLSDIKLEVTGMRPVSDSDYDPLRRIMESIEKGP